MSPIRDEQVPALRRLTPLPPLFIPEVYSASTTPIVLPSDSEFDVPAPTIVVSSESYSQTRIIAPNTSSNDTDSFNTITYNLSPLRSSTLSSDTSYESPSYEEDPFGVATGSWYFDHLPTPRTTPVYTNTSAASSSATLVNSPKRTSTLFLKTSQDTLKIPSRASFVSIKKSLKRCNALFLRPTSTRKTGGVSHRRENSLLSLPRSSLRKDCKDLCADTTPSEHHYPSTASSRTITLEAVKRTQPALLPIASTTHTTTMKCIAGGCTPNNCSHMASLRLVDVSTYRSAALKKKSLMKLSALRVMKLRVR